MCCWTGRLLPCAAHWMDVHRHCAAFSRAVDDPRSMNGDGSSRLGHKWCSNFAGPWCRVPPCGTVQGTVLLIENKDTNSSSVFISFSIVPEFIMGLLLFSFCFFLK